MHDEREEWKPADWRRFPLWVWVLAGAIYPMGPFLLFGSARLLTWPVAFGAAAISGVGNYFVGLGMSEFPEESLAQKQVLLAGMFFYSAVGFLQFQVGWRAGYWTPLALRIWRILAVFAGFMLFCSVAYFLAPPLQAPGIDPVPDSQ